MRCAISLTIMHISLVPFVDAVASYYCRAELDCEHSDTSKAAHRSQNADTLEKAVSGVKEKLDNHLSGHGHGKWGYQLRDMVKKRMLKIVCQYGDGDDEDIRGRRHGGGLP